MLKIFAIACLLLLNFGCASNKKADRNVIELDSTIHTAFVSTMQHKIPGNKNVVYTPTLLFAWDVLQKKLGGPIGSNSGNFDMAFLSNSKTYISTLNKDEYQTSVTVDGDDVSINAYFSILLPFRDTMDTTSHGFTFNGVPVKGFGMPSYKEYIAEQIAILYYESDEKFVVKLFPKNTEHEIIIAKGFDTVSTFEGLMTTIYVCTEYAKKDRLNDRNGWQYYLLEEDEFLMPVITFNYKATYQSLGRHGFYVNGSLYTIKSASQTTSFSINETGSKVESSAEIAAACPAAEPEAVKPPVKHLLLNKPFFLLQKKYGYKYPYFMMKVNNTEIMTKQ